MKTKVLKDSGLDEAVRLLKKGEVVAVPTETVYGLAADVLHEQAVKKIFSIKGRPLNHPLIIHISSFQELEKWTENIPSIAKALAKQFWPGPLTMVFHRKKNQAKLAAGGLGTIAIRVPNQPLLLEILKKLQTALAAPSANEYKKLSPTRVEHVLSSLEGKIPAVLNGGDSQVGIESTILDLTKDQPTILRLGPITPTMIEKVIKKKVVVPSKHFEKVSGNLKEHYQPDTPLHLIALDEIKNQISSENCKIAVLHVSDIDLKGSFEFYKMPSDSSSYKSFLYNMLHILDQKKFQKILVEKPKESEEWLDVLDRLSKASFKS